MVACRLVTPKRPRNLGLKTTATLGYYDTFGSDASELRRGSDIYKPGLVFTIAVAVP